MKKYRKFKSMGMNFKMEVVSIFGGTALRIIQPDTGSRILLEDDSIKSQWQKDQEAPLQFFDFTDVALEHIMWKLIPHFDSSDPTTIRVEEGFNEYEINGGFFECNCRHLKMTPWKKHGISEKLYKETLSKYGNLNSLYNY